MNIVIIGGSRGIGAAAVLAFARAGYNVAFTWHSSASAAEAVVQAVRSAFPDAGHRYSHAHHFSGRKRLPLLHRADAHRHSGGDGSH